MISQRTPRSHLEKGPIFCIWTALGGRRPIYSYFWDHADTTPAQKNETDKIFEINNFKGQTIYFGLQSQRFQLPWEPNLAQQSDSHSNRLVVLHCTEQVLWQGVEGATLKEQIRELAIGDQGHRPSCVDSIGATSEGRGPCILLHPTPVLHIGASCWQDREITLWSQYFSACRGMIMCVWRIMQLWISPCSWRTWPKNV